MTDSERLARIYRMAVNAGGLRAESPEPPRVCGVFMDNDALGRFYRAASIDRTRRLELRIEDLETELAAKGGAV